MLSPGSDIPPYVADIRAQPSALETLLRTGLPPDCQTLLRSIASFDRIVLTGMGSSLHGLYPTFLRLAAAGLPVWCEETAELLGFHHGLIAGNTLLWIASQSGESAEVAELLSRLPRTGGPTVLAATNDLDSSLAAAAHAVIPLLSGPEHTVGTRSYVNTIALGALSTAAALGEEVEPELATAPDRIAQYLDDWDSQLESISAVIPGSPTFVLGRGASLGSARAGALILKEASRCPAEGMSVPQFRHGPLEMADPTVTALIFAGSPTDQVLNEQMRVSLHSTGARCVWIDADPRVEPSITTPQLLGRDARPLAEILPVQLLTVVLAERAGEEPGRFRQIDKITSAL